MAPFSFPPDFFTAPAGKTAPAGVYAVVTRHAAPAYPFTLGTSFFCRGNDCCKWSESFVDIMNYKIAIDPDEPVHRRDISRARIKYQKRLSTDPNFVGPREVGCVPEHVSLNVIHFEAVHIEAARRGEKSSALEHALVIGPCNIEEYGTVLRVLGQVGIEKDHVTMSFQGNANANNGSKDNVTTSSEGNANEVRAPENNGS